MPRKSARGGTISYVAVRRFLNQPCDDLHWLKDRSKDELLKALHSLDPKPETDGLTHHQLVGMLAGITYPQFAFFCGPGWGKTKLMLRLIEYWERCGMLWKAVVLCPSQEAVFSWEDEARKWHFKLPLLPLADGTSVDKSEHWLAFERGLVVLPYPSLRAMVVTRERGKRGEIHEVPQRGAVELISKSLQGIVFDECTAVKEVQTLNYRICRKLSNNLAVRYGLAGRPFGRDVTDLWAQQFLCDRGESLGPTLGLFRAAFFNATKSYFGGPFSFDYSFRKEMGNELQRHSRHRALYYSTEECVDLPPLSRIKRRFMFPPETFEYFERVKKHLMDARGDAETIQNDFVRLRQLSSGHLGIASDAFGAKAKATFDKNPKLDGLMEMLERMPLGTKAVVFYEFTWSGEQICKRLRKAKIPHVWMWAGTKDRGGDLRRFQNDKDCTVMVINHKLGAYALNLQMARYVFYFETPVGCIDRDQSERRCWRQGQTGRVVLYDLVMVGGVDETILAFHRMGKDLMAALTADPKEALKS